MLTRPAWLLRLEEAAPADRRRASLHSGFTFSWLLFGALLFLRSGPVHAGLSRKSAEWARRYITSGTSCWCRCLLIRGGPTFCASGRWRMADWRSSGLGGAHRLRPAAGLRVEISGTLQRHPSATRRPECDNSLTQTHMRPPDALRAPRVSHRVTHPGFHAVARCAFGCLASLAGCGYHTPGSATHIPGQRAQHCGARLCDPCAGLPYRDGANPGGGPRAEHAHTVSRADQRLTATRTRS
jgi:hypothetical protein